MRADYDMPFLLQYENVAWYENGQVRILDRRIYPIKEEYVICKRHEDVAQAIADMVTQSGGPYTAAEMGMVLAANECKTLPEIEIIKYMTKAAYTLSHARPTTVANMEKCVNSCLFALKEALNNGQDIVDAVFQRVLRDLDKKYNRYAKTGMYLVEKFPSQGTVMTQCFAETIIGTMLRACKELKKDIKFICPETRPYFQGARLTASCIYDRGFDVTVISDNMPGYTISQKKVDIFTTAADVITMDGHIINKVGTLQIALAASHYGIPYFVTGTPDFAHKTANSVHIEERDSSLVLESLGTKITLDGVKGYYPAFDLTPPKLCNGVVTDKGILSPYNLDQYYKNMDESIFTKDATYCP